VRHISAEDLPCRVGDRLISDRRRHLFFSDIGPVGLSGSLRQGSGLPPLLLISIKALIERPAFRIRCVDIRADQ
jgi:hypothetical protein